MSIVAAILIVWAIGLGFVWCLCVISKRADAALELLDWPAPAKPGSRPTADLEVSL
jgi:hypothetical protein